MKKLLCIAAMLLPMCSLMAQNSLIYKAQVKFDEGKMDEAKSLYLNYYEHLSKSYLEN